MPSFDLTAAQWGLAILSALLVGMAKAGIPGLGILVVALLADLFPTRASTGILLPMLIMADICAVRYYHRHADWALLWRIIPPALVGVVLGFFIMGQVDDGQLKMIIGVVTLTLLVLTVLRDRGVISDERFPKGKGLALFAGTAVGIVTMLANAAGPLMVVYILAMGITKKNAFIGTNAWFFLVLNVWKVPFSIHLDLITWGSFGFDLKLLPAILLGGAIGIAIVKRVKQQYYLAWVYAFIAYASIRLLV